MYKDGEVWQFASPPVATPTNSRKQLWRVKKLFRAAQNDYYGIGLDTTKINPLACMAGNAMQCSFCAGRENMAQ